MLKEKFPPEEAWFEFLQVLVDSGYQGILTDYVGDEIQVPQKSHVKARKIRNNSNVYNNGEF